MAGMSTATALLISAGISAATAAGTAIASHQDQQAALAEQKHAEHKAEKKQQEADQKAERERLEGIASNQTATDYGNIWGTDSAKYKDAAQKLSAGTGSFGTDDDETNPFYTRGLI